MTLAVLGPDDFVDFAFLQATLDGLRYAGLLPGVAALLTGGPQGTGALVTRYAQQHWLPVRELAADYASLGREAPLVRNVLLVASCDALVVFLGKGASPTTEHALQLARARGRHPVLVVHLPD
jgi:hypothetical protein